MTHQDGSWYWQASATNAQKQLFTTGEAISVLVEGKHQAATVIAPSVWLDNFWVVSFLLTVVEGRVHESCMHKVSFSLTEEEGRVHERCMHKLDTEPEWQLLPLPAPVAADPEWTFVP